MARLIDAKAGKKAFLAIAQPAEYKGVIHMVVPISEIDKLPTVDAVEVVRCRDCKHSTLPSLITQRYGVPGTLTCHNHNSPCYKRNVKCEGYCPYGERKEDGRNG